MTKRQYYFSCMWGLERRKEIKKEGRTEQALRDMSKITTPVLLLIGVGNKEIKKRRKGERNVH